MRGTRYSRAWTHRPLSCPRRRKGGLYRRPHSKGFTQIILERGLIEPKLKAACRAQEKKADKAAKTEHGVGQHESGGHEALGWAAGVACCLEFPLSEQPDSSSSRTPSKSSSCRRDYCIFMSKCHPELNFIERY
jgi:hypothetical protein